MKKNTAYTLGSLIILLICAFCFVVLPAVEGKTSRPQGSDALVFGKYNGKEIKYEQGSDFADYVSQYGQMYQMYGQQIDQSAYYQIFYQAFNATVLKYAYTETVKNSGYKVPKSAIAREIIPYFSDENGNYSSKLYKQASEDSKQQLNDYAEAKLYAARFTDDTFGSTSEMLANEPLFGLKTSNAEISFLEKYNEGMRGFTMASYKMGDYPLEEKLKFARNNSAKFNKYDMSIITVDEKSSADNIAKRLTNAEITFEDAVSEFSDKNYSDSEGKLSNNLQYQIENMLENKDDLNTVISLEKGSTSAVIQTKAGYSIFKNNGAVTAPDFDSEEMQKTVSTYISAYESTVIEDYFTEKANGFIKTANADNFKTVAEANGAVVTDIEPFPLNYGNVDVLLKLDSSASELTNAEKNENFLQKAFALKMNEISEPIILNDNVVVLLYNKEGEIPEETEINPNLLNSYDEYSASSALMNSDKLENNFLSVYFENFLR